MTGDGKRVALVIGNGAYENATSLFNPTNDAKAVAATLEAFDFKLIAVDGATDYNADLGLINMARALADFSVAAETAETAVFYFAGHGLEVDGQNYLLPKDARLDHVRRIYFETISLAHVRTAIEHASRLRLILLDACRDDPFRVPMRGLEGRRSVARGLANIEPSGNTGIAYAAKHGTTATDGPSGGNSPFAAALLKHLPTPDLEIRLLFGRIRDEVWETTNHSQEPHFYSNFGGQPLFLVSSGLAQATSPAAPEPTETPANDHAAFAPAVQQEERWWSEFRIDQTEDPELIEAYIRQVKDAPLWVYKARQRLAVVQDLLRQREAVAWQAASEVNTDAAFKDYLSMWPSGAHVADAHERIALLARDSVQRLEDEAKAAISLRSQSIKDRLLEKAWKLNFQPHFSGKNKQISFNKDGTIGEGQNNNEHGWRWDGNTLELIRKDGSVNNRFEYDPDTDRLISNQPSAVYNIRGQFIYRD